MPALVMYNGRTFRLKWLGQVKQGPFAGLRRARLQALKGTKESFWVPATEISFLDAVNKSIDIAAKPR
jgi:hypothetical protein